VSETPESKQQPAVSERQAPVPVPVARRTSGRHRRMTAPTPFSRLVRNRLGDGALALSSGAAILIVLLILGVILGDVITHGSARLSLGFFFSAPTQGMTEGGIFPALFGTVAMVMLMTVAVVPVGVATAVYMHEYARANSWLTRWVRVAVNNLAGVPSIVFGLFGLGFFVQFVGTGMDRAFHGGERVWGQPALVWAAFTMAVLTLPVVIVATEEALRAVPRDLREASLALGATKFQTVLKVVLPQAVPGILTGTILAISRGAGEVAPILFTGVAYFLPTLPRSLHEQFMHLGNHIYVLSTQSPDVDATKPLLYSTVLVLLILTFILNISAVVVRARMRRRFAGNA
jgi:phosphate transport system permease protein